MESNKKQLIPVLVQSIDLELIVDDGPGYPIKAEIRYDSSDPYAVSLVLGSPDRPNVWTFGRELLATGLCEPAGDGDLHVWPGEIDGIPVVLIELTSDDEEAILSALPSQITLFLAMSHQLVAPGEESDYCDIDGLIAAIRSTVTNGSGDE